MTPVPLNVVLSIVARNLELRASVLLDVYPAISAEIHLSRYDSVPGRPAFCEVRSVRLEESTPFEIPVRELENAAQTAADERIDEIAGAAEAEELDETHVF